MHGRRRALRPAGVTAGGPGPPGARSMGGILPAMTGRGNGLPDTATRPGRIAVNPLIRMLARRVPALLTGGLLHEAALAAATRDRTLADRLFALALRRYAEDYDADAALRLYRDRRRVLSRDARPLLPTPAG
jgi:hypothetical protein